MFFQGANWGGCARTNQGGKPPWTPHSSILCWIFHLFVICKYIAACTERETYVRCLSDLYIIRICFLRLNCVCLFSCMCPISTICLYDAFSDRALQPSGPRRSFGAGPPWTHRIYTRCQLSCIWSFLRLPRLNSRMDVRIKVASCLMWASVRRSTCTYIGTRVVSLQVSSPTVILHVHVHACMQASILVDIKQHSYRAYLLYSRLSGCLLILVILPEF